MSGLIDKRKRSREDDICDSTPLSKRINQLHLTNLDEPQQAIQQLHFNDPTKQVDLAQAYNSNHINNRALNMHLHNKHDMSAAGHQHQMHLQHPYAPELNEAENPFYYIKNKLLYELHFERLKRCVV
ncbi:PREDICTED: uncharacterized protein LOC108362781 [Rhagoletis zephyria]|uniref:uncharacterized protein LOC108362781 n=1 Tax=Rhagoletis zephyria TaxID=28612 RepID=UPI0008115C26|nr:PREDICTED: uncharacterized protein LOC108362781 [Rhagoletis zephyria]XP_036339034.1 uncharacterized protein LOC118748595 [Rhagoletis pomonella]